MHTAVPPVAAEGAVQGAAAGWRGDPRLGCALCCSPTRSQGGAQAKRLWPGRVWMLPAAVAAAAAAVSGMLFEMGRAVAGCQAQKCGALLHPVTGSQRFLGCSIDASVQLDRGSSAALH